MPTCRYQPRPRPAVFRPGHVFAMPKDATWLNLGKVRPFALATACSVSEMGTLVYGSTRETEKWAGAEYVDVAPVAAGVNANGLVETTLFYPGVLIQIAHPELPSHIGHLGKSLPVFRAAPRRALGIGTGTCLHPQAPAGSRRGRIVRLRPGLAEDFYTPFAVILTEHRYSREN